jgi:hypothetical protein
MTVANLGQRNWQPRGASTNEYIVEVGIEKDIHYESEWATLFGRLNGFRHLNVTQQERDGESVNITGGGETSPVWEKTFGEENREARFTYEEHLTGTRTFGQSDVQPGAFTSYKHEAIFCTQIDTRAYPILDRESQYRQSGLIPMSQVIPAKKNAMKLLVEKWKEIDAFSAICDGASQPYLDSTNGGLNKALPGATAGQNRSCWNTWVAGQTTLTIPAYSRTAHEGTLSTLLNALTNSASCGFSYDLHQMMSWQIQALKFPSVKVGSGEWRAVCLIDPWLLRRLTKPSEALSTLFLYGTPRTKKNPALDNMQVLDLDDILYIPSMYWQYFRPTADNTTVKYLDPTVDPFDPTYANTSCICMAYYFTAGALLRGRSTKVWFTASGEGQPDGGHKKGTTFAMHYDDTWKRTEWTAYDGRSALANDRSLMLYAYDPGPGYDFAS